MLYAQKKRFTRKTVENFVDLLLRVAIAYVLLFFFVSVLGAVGTFYCNFDGVNLLKITQHTVVAAANHFSYAARVHE